MQYIFAFFFVFEIYCTVNFKEIQILNTIATINPKSLTEKAKRYFLAIVLINLIYYPVIILAFIFGYWYVGIPIVVMSIIKLFEKTVSPYLLRCVDCIISCMAMLLGILYK